MFAANFALKGFFSTMEVDVLQCVSAYSERLAADFALEEVSSFMTPNMFFQPIPGFQFGITKMARVSVVLAMFDRV